MKNSLYDKLYGDVTSAMVKQIQKVLRDLNININILVTNFC